VFASSTINPIFKDAQGRILPVGWIEGNGRQMLHQAGGVAIAWVVSIVGTLVLLKIVDLLIGLRVDPSEETAGLDVSLHGEEGYDWEIAPS